MFIINTKTNKQTKKTKQTKT